jgi:dTMP kinase
MPHEKGLLISFDGPDSSGKETQARRLAERLKSFGFTVRLLSSPDYTTSSGRELKARLQNKLGDWSKTPWREKLRYFAANRAEHRAEVVGAIARGEIVIYDRYVPSSLAFIAVEARQEDGNVSREAVYAAVAEEEYGANSMPPEDISIFLDVPVDIASELLEERKKALSDDDEYTDHIELQRKLHEEYVHLSQSDEERFLHIVCTEAGQLLVVDEVHERIWQGITQRFPHLA